jgi:hypothetical protein
VGHDLDSGSDPVQITPLRQYQVRRPIASKKRSASSWKLSVDTQMDASVSLPSTITIE